MIIKGISWGQNLKVSDHAFTVIRQQGGVIEEISSQGQDIQPEPERVDGDAAAATGEAGEPSSFVEKVEIYPPEGVVIQSAVQVEPVVGSVTSTSTSVNLARKEGFLGSDGENRGEDEDDGIAGLV
jgi:hypothetical protein